MEVKEDRRLDCLHKDWETSLPFSVCCYFMKIYRPADSCFKEMKGRMNRRALPENSVRDTVNSIIQDVAVRGDAALFDYAARFDKVSLDSGSLFVPAEELQRRKLPWRSP